MTSDDRAVERLRPTPLLMTAAAMQGGAGRLRPGHSSLGLLRTLPADILKVDKYRLGYRFAPGYRFARPLPPTEVAARLAAGRLARSL